MLIAAPPQPAPERVVRVTLLPFVEEAAPGPKAPAPAPAPPAPVPPAPEKVAAPPPKPAAPARPAPKPRAVAVASPKPVAPAAAPAPPAPAEASPAPGAAGNGAPRAVSSAPPAGAGGRAGNGAGGEEIARYVSRVRTQLARHLVYPPLARRRGLEGTVLIELRIDADGRVASARAAGGDRRVFARSALAAIDRAGRFPAPPRGALAIEVPMSFELDDR